MSAAPACRPPLLVPLDAAAILAEARAAAFHDDDPKAQRLVAALRLTHQSESALLQRLASLCRTLEAEQRGDLEAVATGRMRQQDARPWPLRPPLLWELLQGALHYALRTERSRSSRPWLVAIALWHGPAWLKDAAQLAQREAHRMRRPGGWRLPVPVADGRHLVAELRANDPGPSEPAGEVLRLTWADSAHLVAQSKPGCLAVLDPFTEPS